VWCLHAVLLACRSLLLPCPTLTYFSKLISTFSIVRYLNILDLLAYWNSRASVSRLVRLALADPSSARSTSSAFYIRTLGTFNTSDSPDSINCSILSSSIAASGCPKFQLHEVDAAELLTTRPPQVPAPLHRLHHLKRSTRACSCSDTLSAFA
jgi:hypothetical protein